MPSPADSLGAGVTRHNESPEIGFPSSLRGDVALVAQLIPPPSHRSAGSISVNVGAEPVEIPYRVFFDEVAASHLSALDDQKREILHCIYSRHHDGFVRQRHIEAVLDSANPWVMPFVVQLIGEYVIEIMEAVRRSLGNLRVDDPRRAPYRGFVLANDSYMELTSQRVASYWNCYYRGRYSDADRSPMAKADYPGLQLMELLRSLGAPDDESDSA